MKNLGESIVLAANRKTRLEFNKSAGMADVLDSSDAYKLGVCKIAADIYRGAGDCGKHAVLYDMLSKQASWNDNFDPMVSAVEVALSGFCKSATSLPSLAGLAMAAKEMPGGILGLTGLGALLGAGGGALAHTFTSDSQAGDKETESMLQELEAYRRLRGDIEQDLAASGVTETPDKKDDQEFIQQYEI